ncbi:MAG TPA: AAA family ATPase, partial [Patescibacteria group bacterium]|nr:AAA family ATPase [Patescibacteria group bacterium]
MSHCLLLGGPNGAGKTTAARALLPRFTGIAEFVNADEIARGLSPFNPNGAALSAGRIMLERMEQLRSAHTAFAFETTCAGRGHAAFMRRCRDQGYRLTVLFFWLPSPELAIARVAERVRLGGHDIPPDIIRRRYAAGLRNLLEVYWPLADDGAILDNETPPARFIVE